MEPTAGVDAAAKVVPIILIGVMGNSVIYLIPLLVGGMVSDRGFSESKRALWHPPIWVATPSLPL